MVNAPACVDRPQGSPGDKQLHLSEWVKVETNSSIRVKSDDECTPGYSKAITDKENDKAYAFLVWYDVMWIEPMWFEDEM